MITVALGRPLIACIAALVCHEYPLVIMIQVQVVNGKNTRTRKLQLLPKYFEDVLQLSATTNGFVSALPMLVL